MEGGTGRSSSSLPPGWVAIMDPATGREYYANVDTRETRWDPPPPFPPPPSSQRHSSSLRDDIPLYPGRGGMSNEERSDASHYSHYHHGFGGGSRTSASNAQSRGTSTHPTLPREGNKDYQDQCQLVIPTAQAMFDNKIAATSSAAAGDAKMRMKSSDLELTSLTAGQIADLCRIQRRTTNDQLDKDAIPYYIPLNPNQMSQNRSSSHMDTLDAGGIDVRLFALNAKLEHYRAEAKGETIDI